LAASDWSSVRDAIPVSQFGATVFAAACERRTGACTKVNTLVHDSIHFITALTSLIETWCYGWAYQSEELINFW